VKVPHEPAELEARLARIGWRVSVSATSGPFYWGSGVPSECPSGHEDAERMT
jgi:hypothetical protein